MKLIAKVLRDEFDLVIFIKSCKFSLANFFRKQNYLFIYDNDENTISILQ